MAYQCFSLFSWKVFLALLNPFGTFPVFNVLTFTLLICEILLILNALNSGVMYEGSIILSWRIWFPEHRSSIWGEGGSYCRSCFASFPVTAFTLSTSSLRVAPSAPYSTVTCYTDINSWWSRFTFYFSAIVRWLRLLFSIIFFALSLILSIFLRFFCSSFSSILILFWSSCVSSSAIFLRSLSCRNLLRKRWSWEFSAGASWWG